MTIKFDENTGLIPAIIQDEQTKIVLMLGYMNQEAYEKTLATRKVTFLQQKQTATLDQRRGKWKFFKFGRYEK